MPKDELEGVNQPLSLSQELAAEAALLKVGTRIVTGLYSFLVVALAVAVGGAVWVTETNVQIRTANERIGEVVEQVKALREDLEEEVKEARKAAAAFPRWAEDALSRLDRKQERQQIAIDAMKQKRNGG